MRRPALPGALEPAPAPETVEPPQIAEPEPVPAPEATEPAPAPKPKSTEALEQERAANQQRIAELDDEIGAHNTRKQKYYEKASRIEKEQGPDFRDRAAKARRQATNEERLKTGKEQERHRLQRENERIAKEINPPPEPQAQLGPGPAQPRGGAYKDIPTAGGEVNHIPADSVSPLSTDEGPGIWMEKADHVKTKSWGSSRSASAWRERQAQLIKQGRFRDAVEMDIQDIESQFGNKYKKGIEEMRQYIDSLDPKDLRP